MTDEDRDPAPSEQGEDGEITTAGEDAYPALELTQLTESERGGHDGLLADD